MRESIMLFCIIMRAGNKSPAGASTRSTTHLAGYGSKSSRRTEVARGRCCKRPPQVGSSRLSAHEPRGPVARWWRGKAPEPHFVSESINCTQILLSEAKWSARPIETTALVRVAPEVVASRTATEPAAAQQKAGENFSQWPG